MVRGSAGGEFWGLWGVLKCEFQGVFRLEFGFERREFIWKMREFFKKIAKKIA